MGVRAIDVDQGLTEESPRSGNQPRHPENRPAGDYRGRSYQIWPGGGGIYRPGHGHTCMVTDRDTPQEYIQALKAQGVRIISE